MTAPAGPRLALIDRYALRMTLWPMLGCLAVTLISLLLERALRLLDLLSNSSSRFGPVVELTTNLLPHYLGLALPVAFFIALFLVITRLDDGAEIEALLASGVSLSRFVRPYVGLGVVLMAVSLVVFGYLQPYSRYAYRAVLHAAVNAGWDGRIYGGAFISDGDTLMTADSASLEGRRLGHILIRRPIPGGGEEVITARSAQLVAQPDGKQVTLILQDGRRVSQARASGPFDSLSFQTFTVDASLAGATALMRARGGDERELTLNELLAAAGDGDTMISRGALMAEFYGRLARSVILPFLPLIALPLGLAAKRRRRTAGLLLAGVLMLGFQNGLQFGQGLAQAGRISPELGVGGPVALFVGFAVWMFMGSRHRPGETPIGQVVHSLGDGIEQMVRMIRPPRRVEA